MVDWCPTGLDSCQLHAFRCIPGHWPNCRAPSWSKQKQEFYCIQFIEASPQHPQTNRETILLLVLQETREVSKADGEMFARRQGCLFAETSAKADVAVSQAFEELILKILETPALLDGGPASHPKPNLGSTSASNATQSCCG